MTPPTEGGGLHRCTPPQNFTMQVAHHRWTCWCGKTWVATWVLDESVDIFDGEPRHHPTKVKP